MAVGLAYAAPIHRQGFEGRETVLRLGHTDDPTLKLLDHRLVGEPVRERRQAEQLTVRARSGRTWLGEYDFGSIMHYDAFGCAKDMDYPTIIPKRPIPDGVEMGQRVALSAGDIAAVEELYASIPRPLVGPRP